MENLLSIIDAEKPGKRKSGENLPLDAGGQTPEAEAKPEEPNPKPQTPTLLGLK